MNGEMPAIGPIGNRRTIPDRPFEDGRRSSGKAGVPSYCPFRMPMGSGLAAPSCPAISRARNGRRAPGRTPDRTRHDDGPPEAAWNTRRSYGRFRWRGEEFVRIKTASPVGEFGKMNDFWDRMKRELRDAIRGGKLHPR